MSKQFFRYKVRLDEFLPALAKFRDSSQVHRDEEIINSNQSSLFVVERLLLNERNFWVTVHLICIPGYMHASIAPAHIRITNVAPSRGKGITALFTRSGKNDSNSI